MILVNSENVFCAEMSRVRAGHPTVALCSSVGVQRPAAIA